jgi:tryptophan synthase alpha chain
MNRIAARVTALKAANRKAFVPFLTAGDPTLDVFAQLLAGLPKAGCDLIEIGMPFSDPMADGPAIERANLRAFAAGVSLKKIIAAVTAFRQSDHETPIILMGYLNPILAYGIQAFCSDAAQAGVDGLIIADLPPEEDAELRSPAKQNGLDIIRLVTPTTDAARLPTVLRDASGFLYYVAVTGITGGKLASAEPVGAAVATLRSHTSLPVMVGFGITTPDQARALSAVADGVVVGSAIVNRIAANLDDAGQPTAELVGDVLGFVQSLAEATHGN